MGSHRLCLECLPGKLEENVFTCICHTQTFRNGIATSLECLLGEQTAAA